MVSASEIIHGRDEQSDKGDSQTTLRSLSNVVVAPRGRVSAWCQHKWMLTQLLISSSSFLIHHLLVMGNYCCCDKTFDLTVQFTIKTSVAKFCLTFLTLLALEVPLTPMSQRQIHWPCCVTGTEINHISLYGTIQLRLHSNVVQFLMWSVCGVHTYLHEQENRPHIHILTHHTRRVNLQIPLTQANFFVLAAYKF